MNISECARSNDMSSFLENLGISGCQPFCTFSVRSLSSMPNAKRSRNSFSKTKKNFSVMIYKIPIMYFVYRSDDLFSKFDSWIPSLMSNLRVRFKSDGPILRGPSESSLLKSRSFDGLFILMVDNHSG